MAGIQIITPKGETSYANVFRPQKAMQEGKPDQYSLTILWEEGNPKLEKLRAAIEKVAADKWGTKAKKMLESGQLKNPLRPGSDKEGTTAEDDYAGKLFLTARSTDKPEVVDEDTEPMIREMDFYSGCLARMDIYLYAFDKAGNKGVAAILNSVQKLGDGDRKSGRRPASSAFSGEEDDEELLS